MPGQIEGNLDAEGFYAPQAAVSIVANGPVGIQNAGVDVFTAANQATDEIQSAVYRAHWRRISIAGNLDIATMPSNALGAPTGRPSGPCSTRARPGP